MVSIEIGLCLEPSVQQSAARKKLRILLINLVTITNKSVQSIELSLHFGALLAYKRPNRRVCDHVLLEFAWIHERLAALIANGGLFH